MLDAIIDQEPELPSSDLGGGRGFAPEVSIVMPCLNEIETLEICIREAQGALVESGIEGEIIIADNGSTDGSQALALSLGARVVPIPRRGYGSALMGGIAAARGRYVVMGDSDASYDFGHVPRFVERLRAGDELVMGNRFLGGVQPGAMPWKHRYLGNPVLTGIGRLFFHCPAGDFHCGLRGFSKAAYERMRLCTPGMEFASEMVIKSTLAGLRISEIPTILRPDGRSRPPHLRSWRDGWRHLRFMLLFCPRWLFVIPGACLLLVGGMVATVLGLTGTYRIGGIGLSTNTMLVGGMTAVVGYQILMAGLFARTFGAMIGSHPPQRFLENLRKRVTLEHGVALGAGMTLAGGGLLLHATALWRQAGFGALDPGLTMHEVIPAVMLVTVGIQTVFGSFFLGLLGLLPNNSETAPTVREAQ